MFTALIFTLKSQGYLDSDGNCDLTRTQELADILLRILAPEVKLTIREGIAQAI
ncbi:hypothetical protein JCM19241_2136 [Vibrio ishigakensis]|uniref:Uncharacterized protein n=1 Tax=Vibrio ishigakensis TaxID=1481914 RepID=A0A0B8QGU0_9VIBR|nr:hypothetical protein JCM19241_2136 [Vibrio ishigakensis]